MRRYLIVILFFVLLFRGTLDAQTFKIIVNNANPTTSLTKTEISNFLLKKRTKWSNGKEVVPADLSAKSAVRSAVSADVIGKTVGQVRAYWQQSVFSGKDTPPREFESDAAVIEFVKANPGAIAYISSGNSASGVKVISLN